MRLLFFSDLHAHSFKPLSTVTVEGINSRLADSVIVLSRIIELVKEYEVDGVLFGGDLFHIRTPIQTTNINIIYDKCTELSSAVKFFLMIPGNHDQVDRAGKFYSIKMFNKIAHVVHQLDISHFEVGNEKLRIVSSPFKEDNDPILRVCETIKPTDAGPTILLAHMGISGAQAGSNFVTISENLPTVLNLYPEKFDQIFLGHYHIHQQLAENVHYIGAPMQHNWGDRDQERGVMIWDTHPEMDCYKPAFIPLEVAPKFIQLEHSRLDKNNITFRNNFVQIVFDEPPDDTIWENMKNDISAKQARTVDYTIKKNQKEKTFNLKHDPQKFSIVRSPIQIIENYVAEKNPEHADDYIEFGNQLLERALKNTTP